LTARKKRIGLAWKKAGSGTGGKSGRESVITFGIVSLGCPKNLVDSENIAAGMLEGGFVLQADETQAEVIVVNTCSFIEAAREESASVIGELAARRKSGTLRALIVAGCMAQQEGANLLRKYPEIDLAVSFSSYPRIVGLVRRVLETGKKVFEGGNRYDLRAETGRLLLSGPYTAYLRIAEGCSNKCTFCTIPSIRGPFRSKPFGAVLEEAGELAGYGVKEIILIAQDTTLYGTDLRDGGSLPKLLSALDETGGFNWIRLMYANPARVTDELIDAIAGCPRVVKYLDLPIQHISGPVLKRMGRLQGEDETREVVRKLHDRIPGLVLRTSLIAGFPGETDEDFGKLLDFVNEGHFQRLGVFAYSREEHTPAGRMPGHLPEHVVAGRRDELMRAQQRVAFAFAESLVGSRLGVLVERAAGDGGFEGRTFMDAPDVDGKALIPDMPVRPGIITELEVIDTEGYDLILG
jgi:ribosomal protein S12 methylthiotransferase